MIDHLTAKRILDDARLVSLSIEANQGKRAISPSELRRRLEARGADPTALALIECAGETNLEPLLARFAPTDRDRARAYRFLASRGFGDDEIITAIERFLAG